jgi:hypothetical protein
MNLTFVTISDKGKSEERLHFRAAAELDLSSYAVFDTVAFDDKADALGIPDRIFPGQRTCFWFSAKKLNVGESVILYTRAGNATSEQRADGLYHFIFRGLPTPLYTSPRSAPTLFEVNTWMAKK